MILNTSKHFALHLSGVTAIFLVGCCPFGPSLNFGLKMELTACADLVGGTAEQYYICSDIIWWYDVIYINHNYLNHTSAVPQQLFLLIAANLAQLDISAENGTYGMCRLGCWYNGANMYLYWSYMILSMIWNTSERSESHISRAIVFLLLIAADFALAGFLG